MKMLTIWMMLVIVLASCLNDLGAKRPVLKDQIQLSPNFSYVMIDGKEYIDIEESKCFSRNYRVTKGYIGPTTLNEDLNIKECHKIIGYAPEAYGLFATWLEDFRSWLLGFK